MKALEKMLRFLDEITYLIKKKKIIIIVLSKNLVALELKNKLFFSINPIIKNESYTWHLFTNMLRTFLMLNMESANSYKIIYSQ